MKIKIKSVKTYEDWEIANKLIKDAFFPNSFYNPYQEENIKLITQKEEILGSFTIKREDNKALFNFLNIKEEKRNKGIGSLSMVYIEKYLKFKGFNQIELFCNDYLLNFYKRLDYKVVKENNDLYKMFKKI